MNAVIETASGKSAPQAPTLLGPEPLYKQVKTHIVTTLAAGTWKPGQLLPSERKLAESYKVGIATIRAAIGELVAARVLARRQGKGTFVCLHEDRRSIYQFFHVVRNDGVKALPVSELLSIRKSKAESAVADLLQLPRNARAAQVYKLRNVLRVSGVPVVVSDIVIPARMFPGLDEHVIREGGETLYAVYQMRFGVSIIRAVEQLRAVAADTSSAKILGLAPASPALEVRRIAYTFNDVPVEVRRSVVETDHYHYLLEQGSAHR